MKKKKMSQNNMYKLDQHALFFFSFHFLLKLCFFVVKVKAGSPKKQKTKQNKKAKQIMSATPQRGGGGENKTAFISQKADKITTSIYKGGGGNERKKQRSKRSASAAGANIHDARKENITDSLKPKKKKKESYRNTQVKQPPLKSGRNREGK